MNFASNWVYGVGPYRVINVSCTHNATKNGVNYSVSSFSQISIPG